MIEPGPTGRDALKHLFGVVRTCERRHETVIRRTPPFTLSAVVNRRAAMPLLGVVLKVVTSTGLRLDNPLHSKPSRDPSLSLYRRYGSSP